MVQAERIHAGTWRRLKNLSIDREGTPHHPETAKAIGFRAPAVPGNTVSGAAMPAIVDRFGAGWLEGGWYSLKFVTPVHADEDVREVAEPAEGRDGVVSIRVETREGRVCCTGQAGARGGPPWQPELDGTRAGDVFRDIELGRELDEIEFKANQAQGLRAADASGDVTSWYGDSSPWGRPIVPPGRLMNEALEQARPHVQFGDEVSSPLIWAEHAVLLARPLFLDVPYVMAERFADKGRSGRTGYVTLEFTVRDGAGALFATGRHKLKWLMAPGT
jgi:hypothetical protein